MGDQPLHNRSVTAYLLLTIVAAVAASFAWKVLEPIAFPAKPQSVAADSPISNVQKIPMQRITPNRTAKRDAPIDGHSDPQNRSTAFPPKPPAPDTLRLQTFEMQRRLHNLRNDWSDAALAVRNEAVTNGTLDQLDQRLGEVDSKFANLYQSQFLSELLSLREKLLDAGFQSYRDYRQVRTMNELMDVEEDFSDLRVEYRNKVAPDGHAPSGA